MAQPLWQNLLNILFIGFVVRHAAAALAFGVDNPVLRGSYFVVCGACAIAAVALWSTRRWVVGSLLLVAGTYALTVVLALSLHPGQPNAPLLGRLFVVLAAAAGLVVLAQRQTRGEQRS